MHIKPQKAMFLYDPAENGKPGVIRVVDSDGRGTYGKWKCSLGACMSHWKNLSDEEVYQAMNWLALEIVEFAGVPVRFLRDQMEENVIGYRDYCNRVGKLAIGPASAVFHGH